MHLEQQFDRQVTTLLSKQYPKAAGLSNQDFLALLEPLKGVLPQISSSELNLEKGKLPFVIVIKSELIPTDKAMALVEKDGKEGVTKLFPHQPQDFQTISGEIIPQRDAYLLLDIDRGKESINLPPNEALPIIREKHRLPLTIDEGVAIVTQYPNFLMKNNCFSLLASRHEGDQRVPAIWINGNKQPNLGWCWDGNPHTWLGSASAEKRIG